jgi:peptidoglycan hydrolase-like protein with peptidoglycan-binding domain
MKLLVTILVSLVGVVFARADEATANVQQALKDEGFYYGEITGNKDSDTTAAIRRYQIRNGLQITGDLNDETLKSLGVNSAGGKPTEKPSATAAPDVSDLRAEPGAKPSRDSTEAIAPTNPMTGQPFPEPQRQRPATPDYDTGQVAPNNYFAGTPYERTSPAVQRNVIVAAEDLLASRGLYRGAIDGAAGPDLEFSVRAYQAKVRLPVTGRLDLPTLAAMQLLPGATAPVYVPRRRDLREPPVRGEWIPER